MKNLRSHSPPVDSARALRTGVLLLIALSLLFGAALRLVAEESEDSSRPGNAMCLACHDNPELSTTLPSGEVISMGVDSGAFNSSIHGNAGLLCIDCHSNITGYPHPEIDFESHRAYTVSRNTTCSECHNDVNTAYDNGVHKMALADGNLDAAVCSDCHGAHDTRQLTEQYITISHTCQACHSEVFDLYETSTHGAALLEAGNEDVPGCIYCHNAHDVQGPMNAPFRMSSPNVCATCHTDETLMGKYDISTNVWDTWVSDFHGKTVVLFQAVSPGQETDKAVCIDCHGVHDILPATDENSSVMKENLLDTCRKCHPLASSNFPDSWMGHYDATWDKHPIVFIVTWFYRLMIPLVLGGMLVFVVSDYFRQIIDNRRNKKNG